MQQLPTHGQSPLCCPGSPEAGLSAEIVPSAPGTAGLQGRVALMPTRGSAPPGGNQMIWGFPPSHQLCAAFAPEQEDVCPC